MSKPTPSDARELRHKYGVSGVVILAFEDDCTYSASCGSGKRCSADMASLLDEFLRQIGDAEVTVWSEGGGDANED